MVLGVIDSSALTHGIGSTWRLRIFLAKMEPRVYLFFFEERRTAEAWSWSIKTVGVFCTSFSEVRRIKMTGNRVWP